MRPIPFLRRGGDPGQFCETTLQRAMPGMLEPAESVETMRGGIIFLPVLDYQRLGQDEDGGRIGLLHPQDIVALREGRAILLLDLSNEGPQFDAPIFDRLHANLDAAGIPRARVVFVNQNQLLRMSYTRSYGHGGLSFWNFEYFVVLLAMWIDETMSVRIFGQERLDPGNYAPMVRVDKRPAFLCQNAAVRWHRALVYRWLQINDMLEQGIVSFHGIGPDNSKAHEFDIHNPPLGVIERLPDLVRGIENWIPRQALRIDDGGWGNDLVMSLDLSSYAKTDLTIVNESDFFTSGIFRVTEKSIKAAACGNPFIIVGAPRAVSRLSDLGFRTFDGIIDQGYDTIEDPIERMQEAFRSIRAAWALCTRDPHQWRRLTVGMAADNFAHARNGLYSRVMSLIVQPFLDRMALFNSTGIVMP